MASVDPALMQLPWLPPAFTHVLPGRGEMFYRHHQHADPTVPTLLLLHGWTATADLQFFTAYEALAEHFSFIAVDHRGHGRGLRTTVPYQLDDAADDAALLVEALGVGPVVTVGYSMGGPISMLFCQRHPHLVRGMVVQATAQEWLEKRWERWRWSLLYAMGPLLRSFMYPRALRWATRHATRRGYPMSHYAMWAVGEMRRGDATNIVEAGRALSRHDARPWARQLRKPAAMLVTTRDRLVPPAKQRALATALDAYVVEIADDHLCTWTSADEYSASTLRLVQHVVAASVPATPA
jgi:pimeloyl-ACP methyl ester carboxylesterase